MSTRAVPTGAEVVEETGRASSQETVTLAKGSLVALATPAFIQKGKRYAFSWPGGGPPQTFTVRDGRADGWILVDVAQENLDPAMCRSDRFRRGG